MPNDYITHSEYPFDLDYAHQYIRSLAPDLSFLGLAVNHTAPVRLDISSVVNKISHIAYTPCSHIDGFEKNDDSILLIQFPLGECELLVIDGNHRLSSRIYKKVRRIDAYIADYSMSLIGLSDLFEQSLFAFICDIRYVQVNKALLIGQCYNSVGLSCLAK